MDERQRARLVVAGIALSALCGATSVVRLALETRAGDSAPEYWGTALVGGPASQGLPLVPVRRTPIGELAGAPTHLDWYRYNGREAAPGLRDDFRGNDTFHYSVHPETLRLLHLGGTFPWWGHRLGSAVRADHFPADWKGAPAMWRSPSASGVERVPVIVLRVDPDLYPAHVRAEFAPDGFIAFLAVDTDWGCVVNYEASQHMPRPKRMPPYAVIHDPCHDSLYNPRILRAFPLPIVGKNTSN